MAKLTSAGRKALSNDDFAVPEKAPGPCSLPIPDRNHARVARELCHKCGPDACAAVERFIARKFPDMVDPEDRKDGARDEANEKS